MRLLSLPGVFSPLSDTWLLVEALRSETLPPRARVLDLCTGSGAVAIAAALRGARDVTAVDVSRRAMLSVRLNARANRVRVRPRRGDLFDAVGPRRFHAIVSNPPYVPSADDALPASGPPRGWDAGRDGRVLLDRICAQAPAHLEPGGFVLLVHSSVNGTERTCAALAAGGLEPQVVRRRRGPLGPLMSDRARLLHERGLLEPGVREEEIVVVRGRAPVGSAPPAPPSERHLGVPA
jgi:release factor glutamine methyltransferase